MKNNSKPIIITGFLFFFVLLLSCKEKKELKNLKIYPYLITKEYLLDGTIVVDKLGHGISTTLVYDLNGLVQNVKPQDLEEMGLTMQQAFEDARQNLDSALKAGLIKITRFKGPDGIPFILVSDHWLSAASILGSKIFSLAKSNLGTDTVYASIPHRDVLLLFPKCNENQLRQFKAMIKDKESNGRKPLTFELFQLVTGTIKTVE